MSIKLVSWNVNGVRAVNRKGKLIQLMTDYNPDIICLQEIKCDDSICDSEMISYRDTYPYILFNTSQTRKGYSGTAILSKIKPISVMMDIPGHVNDEGRVIAAIFKKCIVITVYTPNSGADLKRLQYRTTQWDVDFRHYIGELHRKTKKAIILCGDLNVAHNPIDIYNPKIKGAGYMPEERNNFIDLLNEVKLTDTFRHMHPDEINKYSYWSNFARSREKNNGWRIDYFLVSKVLEKAILAADIIADHEGSDHAPVALQLNISPGSL